MATFIKLLCIVDGTSSAFPIGIDPTKTIADLKELIKTQQAPRFDDVSGDELTLWHVAIPVEDKGTSSSHRAICVEDVRPKTKLKAAAREISQVVNGTPPKNTIHILIHCPRPETINAAGPSPPTTTTNNLLLEPPYRDQKFPDVETATNYLKSWAVTEGFKLSKRNSEKVTLICSRGDKPRLSVRNKAITRNRVSMKTGCLCRIRLTQPKSTEALCLISSVMLDHNHPLERPRPSRTSRGGAGPPPSQSSTTALKLPSKVVRDLKFAVQDLGLDAPRALKLLQYLHPTDTLDAQSVQAEVARIAASSNGTS
ncbi:hypothetical protein DFQ27_008364 [Actinomortierella ambigua]|uniref:Crinkler effector protein N-terminal domain-containing protein n=1 Tax=Actinomortierella ambigua TaxID=1343610 RepID=A0A9P6QLI3_9FUNG|nr:hypothetical protein DFQ27_008364 [Actinomortierella ambigua]